MSENTERQELRGTLSNTICNASFYPERAQPFLLGGDMTELLDRTADAVLAAGFTNSKLWQVTTLRELEELPFESVIRDRQGHVLERWGGPGEHVWATMMVSSFIQHSDIALPASVLYSPAVPE